MKMADRFESVATLEQNGKEKGRERARLPVRPKQIVNQREERTTETTVSRQRSSNDDGPKDERETSLSIFNKRKHKHHQKKL